MKNNSYKLWLHLEEVPADQNKDPRNMDAEYLPEVFGEYATLEDAVRAMTTAANYTGIKDDPPTGPLLPEDFPAETFQKIKRSALHPELLDWLQRRAWFTAGNPAVNTDEQIEKEFFICWDELPKIRQELHDDNKVEAQLQAQELIKIEVSYFHIIDQ